MNKNYFETIREIILNEEKIKKFEVKNSPNILILNGETVNFEIMYDNVEKLIFIKSISDENEPKIISSWSFDNENSSTKDAKLIAKDFLEILDSKKKKDTHQVQIKKSENESNVTGLFFANRMVTFFPNLKESINEEKQTQKEFRFVTFTRSFILPEILKMFENSKEKNKITKFFKTLSELYKNGNLDVRSVIIMLILNNIENEEYKEIAKESMSEELQKAWKAGLKFKGKKVKPEKIRIRKSFMSKVLEASNNQ